MRDSRHQPADEDLIERRIERLRDLSYADAKGLPEADGEEIAVGRTTLKATVFRQNDPYGLPGTTLITVQVARRTALGFGSRHIERGLVFSPHQPTREATARELRNAGG